LGLLRQLFKVAGLEIISLTKEGGIFNKSFRKKKLVKGIAVALQN
jgi:hypothetical protein